MKVLQKLLCLVVIVAVATCAMTSTLSASNETIAAKPSVGIQWVGTDAAYSTLTIVDGLVTITTTIHGRINVATSIDVDIKLYRLDGGEWRDCGIDIHDSVNGDAYSNTWYRRVLLKGTYKAVVTAYVSSPYGTDTIVMEPTDVYS